MMSGWIKVGIEFIKALAGQWKGGSHPTAPGEAVDTMTEEARGAVSIAVGPESPISITSEAPPDQQEIERAKLCAGFSMIFGCPATTSRGNLRSA